MKKYIEVAENPAKVTHLKVEIYYNLGGYNYFTYKQEARGYYLSVSPVERIDQNGYVMETYSSFSGIKQCIKPVTRKSKKAEAEAEALADTFTDELIALVLEKNNLQLKNNE